MNCVVCVAFLSVCVMCERCGAYLSLSVFVSVEFITECVCACHGAKCSKISRGVLNLYMYVVCVCVCVPVWIECVLSVCVVSVYMCVV